VLLAVRSEEVFSSEMCSKMPIAAMICSLARKGMASHTSGALRPLAIGGYMVDAIGAPRVS